MRNYRTFTDVEESYFREHPEEIDDYITILFEEYAKGCDTGALLSSPRVLGRKGVSFSQVARGHTRELSDKPMHQAGVYPMIGRHNDQVQLDDIERMLT
jgi:hypothetical protein